MLDIVDSLVNNDDQHNFVRFIDIDFPKVKGYLGLLLCFAFLELSPLI
jgi:hypothetical protein